MFAEFLKMLEFPCFGSGCVLLLVFVIMAFTKFYKRSRGGKHDK